MDPKTAKYLMIAGALMLGVILAIVAPSGPGYWFWLVVGVVVLQTVIRLIGRRK